MGQKVLQEVPAAQHVLIVCGQTEVDGYAFCARLSSPEEAVLYENHTVLAGLIRSMTYLMPGLGLLYFYFTFFYK